MNFSQIAYFLAILRTGSFSSAADDSFISQSSISKQIKALETELGIELFRRDHSKVFLSEAGYEFFVFAEKVEAERLELAARLKRFSSKNSYTINLGSIPVVTAYGIANILAKFEEKMLNQNLNVNFDLYSEEQNTVFRALKTNNIDMAFLRPTYLSMDLYDNLLLAIDNMVLICNKDNPLSQNAKISLSTLKNERIILLTPRSTIYQTCVAELTRNNVIKNVISTTGRHEVVLEMVATKLGVTLLPKKLLNKKIHPGLVAVELEEPITTKLVLTKQKGKELDPPAQAFWEFVKQKYAIDIMD